MTARTAAEVACMSLAWHRRVGAQLEALEAAIADFRTERDAIHASMGLDPHGWRLGWRAHGALGRVEVYSRILSLEVLRRIEADVRAVASSGNGDPGRAEHSEAPTGSAGRGLYVLVTRKVSAENRTKHQKLPGWTC